MDSSTVFAIMFVVFVGLMLVGGLISRRWVKDSADMLLAGREVSTFINAAGVTAIGFAGTTMSLAPGFTLLLGARGSILWGTIYCVCGLVLFGLLYAAFIRRCGAQTLPEYLEMRYSPRVRSVVAFTSVIGMCGILANNIVSCAQSVSSFTGWPQIVVMASMFLIILMFSFISGLWAATINDLLQVIMGAIAVPLLVILLMNRYGGFDTIAANWASGSDWFNQGLAGAQLPGAAFTYPSILNFVILFAVALVWGNNYYWMKIASCRSEKVARNSFVAAGFLAIILFMIPLVIVGGYVGAFHGDAFVQLGGKLSHTAAYGFISNTFPPLLGSFFLIGVVAAAGGSEAMMGASSVATRDIYQRLVNPNADPKTTMRATKLIMVGLGALTFLFCQFPGGPTYLFAFANCWLVPPAVLLGLGAIWPRFGTRGAIVGALVGMLSMATLTLLEILGIYSISGTIYLASFGLIVTLVAAVIATLTEKPNYYAAKDWQRVPTATNRTSVSLDEFDGKVLRLISLGHLYMVDLTDTLGVDSRRTSGSIEKLDKGGYLVRAGLNGSKFYTFELTQKGFDALPALPEQEEALRKVMLTPLYVEFMNIVQNKPTEMSAFTDRHKIGSMHMSAICSHLTRRGYILEKGVFKRKVVLTEKGASAVKKYA